MSFWLGLQLGERDQPRLVADDATRILLSMEWFQFTPAATC
jgi:hypothetical protein